MQKPVAIIGCARTAVGRFGGGLASVQPEVMAAEVISALLEKTNLNPARVGEVILGNVLNNGGNIARVAALQAGMPMEVPGVSIDRQCAGGIESVHFGAMMIRTGQIDTAVSGGIEQMTLAPYLMAKPAVSYDRRPPSFLRIRLSPEEVGDPPMGITAENLADRYGISRQAQDQYALLSHQRAVKAMRSGTLADDIVPMEIRDPKGNVSRFDTDEGPRPDTSMEKLAKLKPAFKAGGTVTAGNSSSINDGAAAVLLMDSERARGENRPVLGYVRDYCVVGVDPNTMGIGPVGAIRKLLQVTGLSIREIEIFEINEAFAAQTLAVLGELELSTDKVNPYGGAIAFGHPLGMSGTRLVMFLLKALKERGGGRGVASLCVGGGQGVAMLLEV
ncbi:MAG: thiolase family protein [Desulfobacteraceae bacterium]|nr:MAG: thiolase family protein [Desulfobacteraceae bacterium]